MSKYNCRNCGAELYFEPKEGKLCCGYCGSRFDPSEYEYVPEKEDIREKPGPETPDGNVRADDVSFGNLVSYKCPNCGAEIITSKDTVMTRCPYCDRAVSFNGNISGRYAPDYVIPFETTEEDVRMAYREFCSKKRMFLPRPFREKSAYDRIKGMYIPYWLFSGDGQTSMELSAEDVRKRTSGNIETTETSRYGIHAVVSGHISKASSDALREADDSMMDAVEPFNLSGMKPFNPAYLAGFYSQKWDSCEEENRERIQKRFEQSLASLAEEAGEIMHDTYHIQSADTHFSDLKAEYAMLPVWLLYTEYKGKTYHFAMNGQTGKIIGELPSSTPRIVGVSLLGYAAVQILALIIRIMEVVR